MTTQDEKSLRLAPHAKEHPRFLSHAEMQRQFNVSEITPDDNTLTVVGDLGEGGSGRVYIVCPDC
jgi:hypothetical protein